MTARDTTMKTKTVKQSSARCDAWDADLTDAQRWQAYDKARRSSWYEVAEWAQKEFGLKRAPGRNAIYRWKARMRGDESTHRIEEGILAKRDVGALAAAAGIQDQDLIAAYITMGADMAMRNGDADGAAKYTGIAIDLAAVQTKRVELELKSRAQQTKDEQLKLAREKFQAAEARLNQAKEIVGDVKLSDAERTARMKEIFGL